MSAVFPLPIRSAAVSIATMVVMFVGAGGVPPIVGFLAGHSSLSFAIGTAGPAPLASVVFHGFIPSHGTGHSPH